MKFEKWVTSAKRLGGGWEPQTHTQTDTERDTHTHRHTHAHTDTERHAHTLWSPPLIHVKKNNTSKYKIKIQRKQYLL